MLHFICLAKLRNIHDSREFVVVLIPNPGKEWNANRQN